MYIALLGRQPALGTAELERVFGPQHVTPFSNGAVLVDSPSIDISSLGGTLKLGTVAIDLPTGDWTRVSQKIIQHYSSLWVGTDARITLGISAYGFPVGPREVQKTGILLKQRLKKSGISMRLVPNQDSALSTATSHHNKLGLASNKVELLVVRAKNGRIIVAESTGSQNITAYTRRDQERPKRDAFVGMLPPKLAQIMINLAVPLDTGYLLDPFCGTGVILQEAALKGYSVYGTDLSEKMIRYSNDNLKWLADSHHLQFEWRASEGDAMTTVWQQPIGAVVAETYLGQPFSAPPSPAKLSEVRDTCNHIISTFLKNIAGQLPSGTPICIAVPAWRSTEGSFTHLPLVDSLGTLGFKPYEFRHVSKNDLLYYREDQVVARELLVMTVA